MERDSDFVSYAAARWPTLVRSGVVLGCSLHEAEDLAQTTLVRCFTAWPRVQRADDRDAYVYRMLLNCHRDSRRRRWCTERPTAEPDAGRAAPDATELVPVVDAVHRALAELGAGHREVVVLRHLAGLSEQEAADLLGVPRGTVKSRLSRALEHLRNSPHLTDVRAGDRRER